MGLAHLKRWLGLLQFAWYRLLVLVQRFGVGTVATVVLVHGTGVRQPAYDVVFRRFTNQVAQIRPRMAVAPCYWGGPHGSRLNAGGSSIPSGTSYRGLDDFLMEASADEDGEVALWGLLERDPLFELRLLPASQVRAEELPPGSVPSGEALSAMARRIPADPTVVSRAADAGLTEVLPEAIEAVLESSVAVDALRRQPALSQALRAVLARAFVADCLSRADERFGGSFPIDGEHRDALVCAILGELGGSDRSIGGSVSRYGVNLALRLGVTRPVERRRSAITDATAPAAGDVLMYLARGERIRAFIAGIIGMAEAPIVLIAHSLGGVAVIELLATQALPKVELVVTVGSQAPFLYELDALPKLAFGTGLPETVPRWVNIFDRRDLLAFTGAGVFPGRVEDREVDNGAPFPRSHSAYFASDRFYAVLDEVLP